MAEWVAVMGTLGMMLALLGLAQHVVTMLADWWRRGGRRWG